METGSTTTASATTHSLNVRDFPGRSEKPRFSRVRAHWESLCGHRKDKDGGFLPEQRLTFYNRFNTLQKQEQLRFSWDFWGRPHQFAPSGDWSNWLILAGRGFGKTRTGAEWVRANMCGSTPLARGRWRHIALIAETAADARDVMVGDGKTVSDPKPGPVFCRFIQKISARSTSLPSAA